MYQGVFSTIDGVISVIHENLLLQIGFLPQGEHSSPSHRTFVVGKTGFVYGLVEPKIAMVGFPILRLM